jgi:hypothetical protein
MSKYKCMKLEWYSGGVDELLKSFFIENTDRIIPHREMLNKKSGIKKPAR